jgi:hypothetical protein
MEVGPWPVEDDRGPDSRGMEVVDNWPVADDHGPVSFWGNA